MGIIPNQSVKRFVSCLTKTGQNSIQINPLQSKASIRINPNKVLNRAFNPNKSEIRIHSGSKLGSNSFELMPWIEAE